MTIDQRPVDHFDDVLCAAALEQHVATTRRNQRTTRNDAISRLRLTHFNLTDTVEPAGEHGREFFWHVLDDDHARTHCRQRCQHRLQRQGAAGRGADGHHTLGGLGHRTGGSPSRREDGIRRQFWGNRCGGRTCRRALTEVAQVGAGGRTHGGHQVAGGIGEELLDTHFWVGEDAKRPGFERLQGRLGTLFGQGRADDHRRRPLGHDLAQEAHAIHARHLDIQGDDIRPVLLHLVERKQRVGGRPDDLDIRLTFENLADGLPHHGSIINDHDTDLAGAFGTHTHGKR